MEKEEMAKTTLRLPPEEMKDLKVFCVQNDVTMQAFIENAIRHCKEKRILPKK